MSELSFDESINSSDNAILAHSEANGLAINLDPCTGKAPADATLIPEASMNGTVTADGLSDEAATQDPSVNTNSGLSMALLDQEESEHLRTRWNEIQGKFVDEPRAAVQQADALVSEVVEKIIQMFASEHISLEGQWNQGIDVSTEDLRKALQHYRSFFNRLVV
jgi:hypothetical protein